MSEQKLPRRAFLKWGLGATGAAIGLPAAGCAPTASAGASSGNALRLGVASYSLREFPREQAISMIEELQTPYISIKSFHLPYELAPAELATGRAQFEAAGLEIVGGGVITFEEDSDADVKRYFDYAKAAGMPLMTVTGPPEVWPRVERFAKEYDIKVAIHNHGPEDERYPTPYEALEHVRDRDPRMGVCVDVGHTARTGIDVVQSIADAGSRLIDMHLKDLRSFDGHTDVVVGQGAMPITDIFQQLLVMNYEGAANLEYELDAEDPLPGMKQSFAYMRGVLAGLAGVRSA